MARKLAKSTLTRFRKQLEDEHTRLAALIEEMEQEREEARLAESAAERSPDPNSVEGGSMVFEFEKELSVAANAQDLLDKVIAAEGRIKKGTYGVCQECGKPIPVTRLDALPYVSTCVECASKR